MPGKADHASHAAAIAKASAIASHAPVLLAHLHEILESSEFKGSRRSQEFLRHIVENALEGNFDCLKERTLGMDLFSRQANYDTGEDSIVRVSASDVRKRLLQYYSRTDITSEFQIRLPAGSYVPDFRHLAGECDSIRELMPAIVAEPPLLSQVNAPIKAPEEVSKAKSPAFRWSQTVAYVLAILSLAFASGLWYQNRILRAAAVETSPPRIMPWPTLFDKGHRVHLVVSDTGYSAIQDLLGITIPLSDYAGFHYPASNLNPETARVAKFLSQRHFTAVVDVGIATTISELAQAYGTRIQVRSARELHVQDFKNDDNFILLGSARANPWDLLFDQELDFSVEYIPELRKLIFHNKHPAPGEARVYLPSAAFGQTGDSYAMLAFVGNPNQSGNVLLIAGTSAEGTEMAGKLVTNLETFSQTLRKAGIDPAGPPRRFQLLLRLSSMAGSPGGFDVVAFHAAATSSH